MHPALTLVFERFNRAGEEMLGRWSGRSSSAAVALLKSAICRWSCATPPRPPQYQIPRLLDVEQEHIRSVLEQAHGNRTRAAELLGISRSTIKRKLKKLQIKEPNDGSTRDKLPPFGYTQRHG